MPQHAQYHTPIVEFAGWLVSFVWRPVAPLIDLVEWFGIALFDVFDRRTRWLRKRLLTRWCWQATCAVVILMSAVVTLVSAR